MESVTFVHSNRRSEPPLIQGLRNDELRREKESAVRIGIQILEHIGQNVVAAGFAARLYSAAVKLHLVKHRIGSLTTALYLNAGLLALIALLLLFRDRTPQFLPAAYGQNQPPIGGGAGVFIVPAQFSTNVFGCYLMDIDSQVLSAYQYFPPNNQLRLVASRSFRYDRQLKQYNSDSPNPPEVQKMVEQEQQGARVTDRNTEHAPVEAPKSE